MRFLLSTTFIFCSFLLSAQSFVLDLPRVSQAASVGQTIGITQMQVSYHAPSIRERQLMGNLIPYNLEGSIPWRGGADENTVFTVSTDVSVGGELLPAGSYGLHFWVTQNDITAIFSNNSTSWGSFSYNITEDALRQNVQKGTAPYTLERLHYKFENITASSCDLVMHWGDAYWSIPINVDVTDITLANIREDLQTRPGWLWVGWYEAANFCLANNVNLDEAEQWISRSMAINMNPTNLTTSGLIQLANGKSKAEVGTSLETALENSPATWKEYNVLASFALNNLEDYERANRMASKSIAMNPNFGNTSVLANVLKAEGKKEAAIKMQKEALELSTNAQANAYGYQLLNNGDKTEAVEVFKFNATRFPDDPNVHDSLGEAFHITGDDKNAEASLRKSLSLNPPPNVRQNSLRLLSEMGVNTAKM